MFVSEMTLATMNPEFSGAYLAVAGGDMSTSKLFDTKAEMYSWINDMIEYQGYPYVETTVLGPNGSVDSKLINCVATYKSSEDCYKGGMIEPVCGDSIYAVYQ